MGRHVVVVRWASVVVAVLLLLPLISLVIAWQLSVQVAAGKGNTEQSRAAQRRLSLAGEASTKMCDRLLTNEPPNRGKNDKFAVATAERGNGGSGGSWQRFVAPFNI